jgi:hypothetical protein
MGDVGLQPGGSVPITLSKLSQSVGLLWMGEKMALIAEGKIKCEGKIK